MSPKDPDAVGLRRVRREAQKAARVAAARRAHDEDAHPGYDASQPPPRRTLGWVEALFIAALVTVSLAFIAGGGSLMLRGVPATDRYGMLFGSIPVQAGTALGRDARVVATTLGGSRVAAAPVTAAGAFRLRLPPGSYLLRLESGGRVVAAAARHVELFGGEVLRPTLNSGGVRAASTTR